MRNQARGLSFCLLGATSSSQPSPSVPVLLQQLPGVCSGKETPPESPARLGMAGTERCEPNQTPAELLVGTGNQQRDQKPENHPTNQQSVFSKHLSVQLRADRSAQKRWARSCPNAPGVAARMGSAGLPGPGTPGPPLPRPSLSRRVPARSLSCSDTHR